MATESDERPGDAKALMHDLNNCLGVIRGHAELALDGLQQRRTDVADDLEAVLAAVERLTEVSRRIGIALEAAEPTG